MEWRIEMRRNLAAFAVAACGLFVSWAGQGIWRKSPDEIWAAFAIVGVMSALAIAFEPSLSMLFARLTRPRQM